MLVGLRDRYLKAIKGSGNFETNAVLAIQGRVSEMSSSSQEWLNYFRTILRLFNPELNNVFFDGGGGDLRVNSVFSSEPGTYIYESADFLVRAMFPEGNPWFRPQFRDRLGRPVSISDVSLSSQKYAGDAVDVTRFLLSEGGFYESAQEALLHFLLLGTAPMQTIQTEEMLRYMHVPVHRMPILLSKDGEVVGVTMTDTLDDWEVKKHYGDEGLALFSETPKDGYQAAVHRKPGDPMGMQFPLYSGLLPGGGNSGQRHSASKAANTKEIIRLWVPRADYMGIPMPSDFFPEMEYVCYVLTRKTQRLLDVEVYPTKPFGVATDIRVAGEGYSRGIGGRALPDVAVLNKKKNAELVVDSLVSQSPLVLEGRGFQKPIGKGLRPWQLLHIKPETKLGTLYDPNSIYQRTHQIYESELATLREIVRKDKQNVALQDRMTASEFQQRQDASWGTFAAMGNRVYRTLAAPILRATLNYAILKGALPSPPSELQEGSVSMDLQMVSAFSYGQPSELGQNLARALAPIAGLIEGNPRLLDGLDTEKYLKASLASHELAEFSRSEEDVRRYRENMAQMERASRGGGQQRDPEQEARDAVMQGQVQEDIAGERILDYAGLL